MILVLSSEGAPGTGPGTSVPYVGRERLCIRSATSNQTVLDWISAESFERIVVMMPTVGINPFALSRSLRRAKGPKLVLTGEMRPFHRYWAERNGCLTASSLEAALET